jgi:hypothetical protein
MNLSDLESAAQHPTINDKINGDEGKPSGRGGAMAKTRVVSGMWRIDPQKWSRVIDRSGQPVASVETRVDPNSNAALIAAAPDMFELLEVLDTEPSIPEVVKEEIQWVLRRARGDFGIAVTSRRLRSQMRANTQEWLDFMEGLWKAEGEAGGNATE